MPKIADRVKETTTTTGTGTVTLAGAVSPFRAFSAAPEIVSGDLVSYAIIAQTGGEWEVGSGIFTLSGTTITRSSGNVTNGSSGPGVLVNFSAGTKDVFSNVSAAFAATYGAASETRFAVHRTTGTGSDQLVIGNTLNAGGENRGHFGFNFTRDIFEISIDQNGVAFKNLGLQPNGGNVAVGTIGALPSAVLHVGLGTAANGQFRLSTSPLLTTPVPGVLTFDGTGLWLDGAGTRRRLDVAASGEALRVMGDSISRGYPVPATSWSYLLADQLGWTLTNVGLDGAMAAEVADQVYSATIVPENEYAMHFGINDARIHGVNAARQAAFKSAEMALVAWLAIPETAKIRAVDTAAITYTGSWGASAAWSGAAIGRYSQTNGSTATCTVSGSVIYIGSIFQNPGGGTFTVHVDGVLKATLATDPGDTITSLLGRGYMPRCIRIGSLANTAHTVLITVTSATSGSNTVYLDWIAGNRVTIDAPVLVGNVTRQTAAGYAANGGSDALTASYNVDILDNLTTLRADGLNASYIDVSASFDPNTETVDGIHCNDAGQEKIKNIYLTGIPDTDLSLLSLNVVSTNTTLSANTSSVLVGMVTVKSGALLTVESGASLAVI